MEKSKKERIEKLSEKTKDLNLDNELYIFVNNIKWGKKANILINCVDLGTNIEFYFSVFFSNKYFSRSGDFNFREYMENFFENSRILAVKFKRSKTGYLNCFNAELQKFQIYNKSSSLISFPNLASNTFFDFVSIFSLIGSLFSKAKD